MTASTGLVLALMVLVLLLGGVLTYCEQAQAAGGRAETVAPRIPALAQERSLELLRAVLDEGEVEQWTRQGYLDVSSPQHAQRIYRIRRTGGLVQVYEQGKVVRALCLQPVEPLPSHDLLVLHKLLIQGNEQEYLQQANQFPALFPDLDRS